MQGDGRTYSYVAALSSNLGLDEFCWPDVMNLAKLIPRICHNINRFKVLSVHLLEYCSDGVDCLFFVV